MFKPAAILLRVQIHVQLPDGDCTVYIHQPDPHVFTIYTSTTTSYMEWLRLCTALHRESNEAPFVKCADWLEADVKLREALELPKPGFSMVPAQFDYAYSARPDATFDNSPRYSIQEQPKSQRTIAINTDRRLNRAQVQVIAIELRRAPICESVMWYPRSKQFVARLTEIAWSVPNRLASFAALIELTATM